MRQWEETAEKMQQSPRFSYDRPLRRTQKRAQEDDCEMATVLVVEDADELAELLVRELSADGHAVRRAEDGERALTLYDRDRPDIVILDWMLPKMEGIAVLRQLRQRGPTPVLMLTARGEEVDRVIGLEVGADDYLTKPFGVREFLARVRALLRREETLRQALLADRAAPNALIEYGDLKLDPDAHEVTICGEPIDLTPTEFDLLQLLMRSPGRTFSRSYLLETVWSDNLLGGERAVDNTVLRLRKKLGPLKDGIETVWSVGYRLKRR
jgi:DNA-binding response OmpR family regulator